MLPTLGLHHPSAPPRSDFVNRERTNQTAATDAALSLPWGEVLHRDVLRRDPSAGFLFPEVSFGAWGAPRQQPLALSPAHQGRAAGGHRTTRLSH